MSEKRKKMSIDKKDFTSNDELIMGNLKERNEVKFSVGDYNVEFDYKAMCFILTHKVYFARIITAYLKEVVFIGDNEDEVINELMIELQKEL